MLRWNTVGGVFKKMSCSTSDSFLIYMSNFMQKTTAGHKHIDPKTGYIDKIL